MFGSAKNGSGALTGVERAKLERGQETLPVIDELPPEPPATALVAKQVTAKKTLTFPERTKPAAQPDASAHLYIGGNIRLKGEITGCDMMRIEGTFEGTAQARQMVLCPGGSFLGIADIEEAEIEGRFDGTLNVRGRLFLKNKGRIRGTFSYGQLEIERGGEIEGRIVPFESRTAKPAAAPAKPPAVLGPVGVAPAAVATAAILAAEAPPAPRPVQSAPAGPAVRVVAPQPAKPAAQLNGSGSHPPGP